MLYLCRLAEGQKRKNTQMMEYTKEETAFFSLIRLAIGTCRAGEDVMMLDRAGWQEVYRMACKQALVGVVFDGVERLPQDRRPPSDVLLPWIGAVRLVEIRNRQMNQAAVKVCARFDHEGKGNVLLKGQGVATLYPQPLHRMSGDIDLWVAGSRKDTLAYVCRYVPVREVIYHHVEFPVLKDVEIELHFMPSWMNEWPVNLRLQRLFREWMPEQMAHRVELPEGVGSVPVPTPAMNRVYLLLHIYRHLFSEGIGLRQLLDYYFVLCQPCTEAERAETLRVLERLHMKRFSAAVMYVLQTVFGMDDACLLLPPSERYGRELLREVMLAGNFGQYDERIHYKETETALGRFCRRVGRNFGFLKAYPGEVLWSPLFKLWHYQWRWRHGYLPEQGHS